MANRIFTVGHSAVEFSAFLALLQRHDVKLVADVRSKPQSARHPHFDGIEMEATLRAAGIRYLFMGDELGGRPDDSKAYRGDGLVDYRGRRKSRAFQAGLERVLQEMESVDLALMCAEEDPLSCHRFLMICPEIVAAGIQPMHIRKGGVIETQQDAEDRLLEAQKLGAVTSDSLFAFDREAALEEAYAAQSEKFAFRIDPQALEAW
jgi:uncharacterized protein (DUF488 family)